MVKSGRTIRATVCHVGVAGVLLAAAVGCGGDQDGGEGTDGNAAGNGEAAENGEAAGNPFEGETIDFVVPYDPGGGYDVYTRTVAPYLQECLGAERVLVLNEPGAGSLLATNTTAKAPPDGTRIQIMNMPGVLAAQIAGDEGAQFDLNELAWIGRIASPPDVVLTGADGDLRSFEDFVQASEPIQFVATGPGSSDYIAAAVVVEAYDLPNNIAAGFAGSQAAAGAVVAGDGDAYIVPYDSVLSMIEAGDATAAVLLSEEVPQYMPEAPLIGDFEAPSEQGQELVDQLIALTASGRAVAGPPGIPEDRLTALREGFACAMENDELLAELDSQRRPVAYLSGEETDQLVEQVLNPTEEFQAVIKESYDS